MKEYFLSLFHYDFWANGSMINAFRTLPQEDENALRWLHHIVNAKIIWLDRSAGVATSRGVWQMGTWEQLLLDHVAVHKAWLHLLGESNEDQLFELRSYANSRGDVFQTRQLDILTHVVNHSTHHRAQVAARIREAGFQPPMTDYVFWLRT